MSPRLLSLNCPNCGANITFDNTLAQFACSYCGASIAVRTEGGAVSLHKLSETVERIESHTERAAAELAIARYEKEIAALESQLQSVESPRHLRTGVGCIVAILAAMLAFSVATTPGQTGIAVLSGLGAIAFGIYVYRSSNSTESDAIQTQIQSLRIKLARKRRIAGGTTPFAS
jgi:ribosomal protein S27E